MISIRVGSIVVSNLERKYHPLVGEYHLPGDEHWFADISIEGLVHPVRFRAFGAEPTPDQLERLNVIIDRISEFISASGLGSVPPGFETNPTWSSYSIYTAHITWVTLYSDGNAWIGMEGIDDGSGYYLAPLFNVSNNLQLISAEWSV